MGLLVFYHCNPIFLSSRFWTVSSTSLHPLLFYFPLFFLFLNRGYVSYCRINVFSRVGLIVSLELLPPCGGSGGRLLCRPASAPGDKGILNCEGADMIDSDDSQLTWSQQSCPFLPLIETLKSKLEQSSNRRKLSRTSQVPYWEAHEFNLPRKKQAKGWFENCN